MLASPLALKAPLIARAIPTPETKIVYDLYQSGVTDYTGHQRVTTTLTENAYLQLFQVEIYTHTTGTNATQGVSTAERFVDQLNKHSF